MSPSDGGPVTFVGALGAALGFMAILMAGGCAPSALVDARHEIAAGHYAQAREQLLALESKPEQLTPSQHREVKDDLCLSEFMIGKPAYTLSEQRRVCADAANEPGSQSGELVRRIDSAITKSAAERVESALAAGDLTSAEQAAVVYQATPGADPAVVGRWSRRMWEIVNQQDKRTRSSHKKRMTTTVSQMRRRYPHVRPMDKHAFLRWVVEQGTVNGTSMLSSVGFRNRKLELSVRSSDLHKAKLNIDRFAKINDAMIAWCGCDGRTDVAVAETQFPLYLVRLDPETRRSQVLILPYP